MSTNPLTRNAQNYKGSIEGGRIFHTDDTGVSSTTDIYTVRGIQLGSRFYIGTGVDVRLGDDYTSTPPYSSVRYTFLKEKISPFIDVEVGCNLLDTAGLYANPGTGVNQNSYEALSVFLKVGYTYNPKAYGEARDEDGDDVYPHGVSASIGLSF